MAVLARKISRAKWEPTPELGDDAIAADAVTADLRTHGNTLSFWRCASSSEADLKRAVLALASASERPDRLDLVYLDEAALRERGLAMANTTGNTPVETLREHHVDVQKLDLSRLAEVARMVAGAHRSNACLTFRKRQVVELVAQAVKDGLVGIDDLRDSMKEAVTSATR